jgi:hypothetical protein
VQGGQASVWCSHSDARVVCQQPSSRLVLMRPKYCDSVIEKERKDDAVGGDSGYRDTAYRRGIKRRIKDVAIGIRAYI